MFGLITFNLYQNVKAIGLPWYDHTNCSVLHLLNVCTTEQNSSLYILSVA